MLNTGLLMQRPGESGHGKFRRFIIANRGVHLHSTQPNHSDLHISVRRYNLARVGDVVEKTFLEANKIPSPGDVQPIKLKYRPRKCCPSCMKSGYHSYVFDYHWLHHCPVHKEVFRIRCPECHHQWPSYSEVAMRNCSTCGFNVKFGSTLANESHQPGYQALALVEQIVEVRAKQLLSRAIIGRPRVKHPYFVQEPYRLAIEAESPMVFAVMKELGLVTPDEVKLLAQVTEIEFPEMQSISCQLEPISYDHVFKSSDGGSSQERMLLEKHFEQTLLERLGIDSNKFNKLDAYITDEGINVEQLPWMLYMIALGKDDMFLQSDNAHWWELLQLASALRTRYSEHSVILKPNLDKLVMIENCADAGKQSYIKLPDKVLLLLIQAELTSLVDNIILHILALQGKETVSWKLFRDKTEETIKKVAGADFPVAFVKRTKQLDVIIPKSLEYKYRILWN